MLLDILAAIIVGGIAGLIASKIMNTDESMGFLGNVIVGIIGAFIGNVIARFTGLLGGNVTDINVMSILTALVGAIILLAIVKALNGRSITD